MSVIRKKPEINKIIEALNDTEKAKLAAEVDNEAPLYTKSLINKNYYFSPLSNNTYEIAGILLELAPTNTVPGIVIRTNNTNNLREFFIQISYKQKLIMWRLNTINRTAKMIDEDLNINELRRLLEEVHDHIVASEIDSGEEPANKVLVSDGDGGAEWANAMDTITPETVEEGDAVQLFGFNSQGQLVKDAIPEGITVDQTIIEDSENAVAGGAVYDLKEDVEDINIELETKANVDGNYPTMTVGVADQLSPYDENSGADQDTPFSLQATSTGNGSQPDFSTGAIALLKEKQGNTVVVNQQVKNPEFTSNSDWGNYLAPLTIQNGVCSFTATAQYGGLLQTISGGTKAHKYLAFFRLKLTTAAEVRVGLGTGYLQVQKQVAQTTDWQNVFLYIDAQQSYTSIRVNDYRSSDWDEIKVSRVYLIDLTQWFNGDIPQDLLDHPENFFRYYQGSLAYNAGTLVNGDGRYIKCIGRNQWDEEVKVGYYLDGTTGEEVANPASMVSANFMPCICGSKLVCYKPNVSLPIYFYDTNKNYINRAYMNNYNAEPTIIPTNASYFRLSFPNEYGTTYNNDITISIYYEDETGYDQYYPYEVLTNNDTGTEVLRSAGNAHDVKLPSGEITRRIGYVDLGTLNWNTVQAGIYSCSITKANNKNILNANYNVLNDYSDVLSVDKSIYIGGSTNQTIYVHDSSAQPTGTLYFELAEPTTEQGTPFSENLVIDDFGSMDFSGTSGVPQGALIFYPVDYKAFVDTLYNYTEGTPSNIALKTDLPTAPQNWAESLPGYDATKTQVLKNVEGTLTWVDEA